MQRTGNLKKKIYLIILAILGLALYSVVLGACTGEKRNGNGYQEEFNYLITVGFAQSGEENAWKKVNTESFKSTFIEDNGYELLYEDALLDQEKQYEAIRNFIKEDVDYIVLNPVADTGWGEILKEAEEAGIPVILIQNQIEEESGSLYECWIGNDYKKQVREANEWLEEYLEAREDEKEEETGLKLAVIQGEIGSVSQMNFAESYQEILEKHLDWHLAGQQTGENSRERAAEVMGLFLEEEPDLDIVIAESGEMALGVVDAIEKEGKSCGPDGDIILISFGAKKEVLQAIADRRMNAAFEQNPLQAPKTAEIIQKIEAGVTIDKEQYIPGMCYDTSMDLTETIEERRY